MSWMLLRVFLLALGTWQGGTAFAPPSQGFPTSSRATQFGISISSSTSSASSSSSSELYMNKKKKKPTSDGNKSKGFGGGSSGGGAAAAVASSTSSSSSFPYAGSIRPGTQTPQRVVMDQSIMVPDYAQDGIPKTKGKSPLLPWIVEVKKPEEIVKMKESGKLARQILDLAGKMVQVGRTTDEIDQAVHEATIAAGAYPSPLNYHGFPKSCCTSVNEVICHGIPDDRPLQDGDIINIDITVYLNGYHGDCSEMFVAGTPDEEARQLLQVTYDCWIQACQYVQPGRDYKDLGGIIEEYITPYDLSTVRNFCGHGIGRVFHTTPNILHYRNNEPNGQMAVGHTFTIEPMICENSNKVLSWPDDWTATTVDGGRSAQFEHTLLITNDGVEALTAKNKDSPIQFWEQESNIHQGFFLGTSVEAVQRQDEINAKVLRQ